jgi:hypothetical protein
VRRCSQRCDAVSREGFVIQPVCHLHPPVLSGPPI